MPLLRCRHYDVVVSGGVPGTATSQRFFSRGGRGSLLLPCAEDRYYFVFAMRTLPVRAVPNRGQVSDLVPGVFNVGGQEGAHQFVGDAAHPV